MSEPYSATWAYEVALYKGDELIDSGTVKEVAERRGVRKATIVWYLSRRAHNRADNAKNGSNGIRAVRIDGDEI